MTKYDNCYKKLITIKKFKKIILMIRILITMNKTSYKKRKQELVHMVQLTKSLGKMICKIMLLKKLALKDIKMKMLMNQILRLGDIIMHYWKLG